MTFTTVCLYTDDVLCQQDKHTHTHMTAHVSLSVSFQSNGASAASLLPQWWPVPGQRWLGLRGNHALSPRVNGALPTAGPSGHASNWGPRHAHFPAQGEREGTRQRAASVQWRRRKRWRREEWGRTGAPDRLKGGVGATEVLADSKTRRMEDELWKQGGIHWMRKNSSVRKCHTYSLVN